MSLSPLMKAALILSLIGSLLVGAYAVEEALGTNPDRFDLTDYHPIYIAGQLAGSGRFEDAYHLKTMLKLEEELGGHKVLMPWAYPPVYGFLAAPLAMLGLIPGFLLFGAASGLLFVVALRRLGGEDAWPVLLASFMSLMLNLRCGQNGLMMGGFMALAAAAVLRNQSVRAGGALALMAFKPHLAIGMPFVLLLHRRWTTIAVAAVGAVGLTGASIAVFGLDTFRAFLAGFAEVRHLMTVGAYPFNRMATVYGFGSSIGLPAGAALALHLAVAAAVVGFAARAVLRAPDLRTQLGLAICAGLFVTPYIHDYDLTQFSVGIVLLAPELQRRLGPNLYARLLVALGFVQAYGFATSFQYGPDKHGVTLSLMGPGLLAVFVAVLRTLGRTPDPAVAPAEPVPA
ncbi:MAG: DUF2029 domain-containing protein [Parafilimonas terrae]|nr:DUF2029 domain-containing protein [Parafilimonas terrae]